MRCYLDRDGIFNYDDGYVGSIRNFRWYQEIFEILGILKDNGYSSFVVVTNQSGIGRKYYNEEDFQRLSRYMSDVVIQKTGIELEIVHCPHLPEDKCRCIKPNTGMFERYKII